MFHALTNFTKHRSLTIRIRLSFGVAAKAKLLFLFDLGQQQNHEKKREISSREFRNRFPELIRDRLDREAILSPLGSSQGLQCL